MALFRGLDDLWTADFVILAKQSQKVDLFGCAWNAGIIGKKLPLSPLSRNLPLKPDPSLGAPQKLRQITPKYSYYPQWGP